MYAVIAHSKTPPRGHTAYHHQNLRPLRRARLTSSGEAAVVEVGAVFASGSVDVNSIFIVILDIYFLPGTPSAV